MYTSNCFDTLKKYRRLLYPWPHVSVHKKRRKCIYRSSVPRRASRRVRRNHHLSSNWSSRLYHCNFIRKIKKRSKVFLVLFLHDMSDSVARSAARICFWQGCSKAESVENQDFEVLWARAAAYLVHTLLSLGHLFISGNGLSKEADELVSRLAA